MFTSGVDRDRWKAPINTSGRVGETASAPYPAATAEVFVIDARIEGRGAPPRLPCEDGELRRKQWE